MIDLYGMSNGGVIELCYLDVFVAPILLINKSKNGFDNCKTLLLLYFHIALFVTNLFHNSNNLFTSDEDEK